MSIEKIVETWNVNMVKELGQNNNIILGIKPIFMGKEMLEEMDVGIFTNVFHKIRFQHWNNFIGSGLGLTKYGEKKHV